MQRVDFLRKLAVMLDLDNGVNNLHEANEIIC